MPMILHTAHYSGEALELLRASVPIGFAVKTLDEPTRDCLLGMAPGADYLLVSGRLRIDAAVLDCSPHLKMIQRTGVGTEMLDLDAIACRGVPVYVNRGVNARSVAEHTMLMILSCLKNIPKITAEVKGGVWRKQATGLMCAELYGKTVGLVGMGAVGKFVAGMVKAFGANVVYFDVMPVPPDEERSLGIERTASFVELLARSDVVSFHCPLTADTAGMLSASAIAGMKDGACIVNTARGGLIDEMALAEALRSGKLRAAGLDVRSQEPPLPDDPFAKLDNVILSPHIAGLSREAFSAMLAAAMENIAAFERGDLEKIEGCRISAPGGNE